MSTTTSGVTRPSRGWALALLLAVGTTCSMDAMILSGLLTPIKTDLHLSDTAFGSVASISTIAGIVGAPLFAALASRFSRKSVLIGSIILWSLTSAGSALASGLATLVLWRTLTNFGIAAYQGIAPGWLADLYNKRERNVVFSLFMLRNKLGSALAFGVGGWIAAHADWHWAFLLTGLPGVVLAALLVFLPEPSPGHADGHPMTAVARPGWRRQLSVLRIGPYVTHLAALCLFFSGMMTAQMWLPAFLHRAHGLDNFQATGFAFLALMVTLPAGPIGGWLTGRFLAGRVWGISATLAGSALLASILFFVAFTTPSLTLCKIFCMLAIATFGATAGSLTTLLIETVPVSLRTISGSFGAMVAGGTSGLIAPWLLGRLSDHFGLANAILVGPFFYALSALFWIGLTFHAFRSRAS
ncbi:MFS transporter [Brytella acorum]|uniref:MFS transporter n=1 Tax=Brytella acorum TaxID=2959299 RepID=A0AA35Y4P6_9PROT|nr:MFS transporter [Brytella acorum]MDF3625689.1 MFS transporter [Brytella acorum]CAI9121318.1 MFS transporter [Brytella acorum]